MAEEVEVRTNAPFHRCHAAVRVGSMATRCLRAQYHRELHLGAWTPTHRKTWANEDAFLSDRLETHAWCLGCDANPGACDVHGTDVLA